MSLSTLGLGIASAVAPYVALQLREIDPRGPFLLASVALALVTCGLVAAERALERKAPGTAAVEAAVEVTAPPSAAVPSFLLAAVLAAMAFQVHSAINSTPLYARFAGEDQLARLAPVFWVGFNLAMLPAAALARRFGGWRVMAVAALTGSMATAMAQAAPSLMPLIVAQSVAGAAWGCVLMSAFSMALALGHVGREGRMAGALSSVLALAALSRLGMQAGGWHKAADLQPVWPWLPVACWGTAALVLWWATRRSRA